RWSQLRRELQEPGHRIQAVHLRRSRQSGHDQYARRSEIRSVQPAQRPAAAQRTRAAGNDDDPRLRRSGRAAPRAQDRHDRRVRDRQPAQRRRAMTTWKCPACNKTWPESYLKCWDCGRPQPTGVWTVLLVIVIVTAAILAITARFSSRGDCMGVI